MKAENLHRKVYMVYTLHNGEKKYGYFSFSWVRENVPLMHTVHHVEEVESLFPGAKIDNPYVWKDEAPPEMAKIKEPRNVMLHADRNL